MCLLHCRYDLACRLQPDIDPKNMVYLDTEVYDKQKVASSILDKISTDKNEKVNIDLQ